LPLTTPEQAETGWEDRDRTEGGREGIVLIVWRKFEPRARYRVLGVVERTDNTYTAYCAQLPGAASEGASVDSALESLREAIAGCIESYGADGEEIPWSDEAETEGDAVVLKRWITVDV
jgi:predicted RNase H-like HicB family nuclease